MSNDLQTGQCLCGAVRFRFRFARHHLQACHCGQCQRWTGGSPLIGARVEDTEIEGEDNIARYHASDFGERAFCRVCGTTLFWKMQDGPVNFLCAGLLDDQTGLEMKEEIFIDRRAPWLKPWVDASQSTEAEEIAKFDAWMASREQSDD
jgi:hypothetical protein